MSHLNQRVIYRRKKVICSILIADNREKKCFLFNCKFNEYCKSNC